MPLVTIKPTPLWSPKSEVGVHRELARNLGGAIPGIVTGVWNSMGPHWGTIATNQVLPDFMPPFELIIEDVTPCFDITVMPNYTPQRYENRQLFRQALINRIKAWLAGAAAARCSVPDFDINVNFVMGCGAHIGPTGTVEATWPDKLPA